MTSPYLNKPLRSRREAALDLCPELGQEIVMLKDLCDLYSRDSDAQTKQITALREVLANAAAAFRQQEARLAGTGPKGKARTRGVRALAEEMEEALAATEPEEK